MGIKSFFRHTCNIYSAYNIPITMGYGIPTADKKLSYNEKPDIENCPCCFGSLNNSPKITFSEPINTFDGYNEVSLPSKTNIKKGDKVVDVRFNLEYTAGYPEDIRGKYIVVPLYRKAQQERV